jgi:hypothetical protein
MIAEAPDHQINNPERAPKILAAMKGRVIVRGKSIRKEKIQVFVRTPASTKNH